VTKARRPADAEPGQHGAVTTRGLDGVKVADTSLGGVRGDEGFFHYRQYDAVELAATRPLVDVWRLLFDGALPATVEEREVFAAEVAELQAIPGAVVEVLPTIARSSADVMEAVRTAMSFVGAVDGMRPTLDIDHAVRRRDALRAAAVMPALIMAVHRARLGLDPVAPDPSLGYGANYLWMLTGERPDPEVARAIEQYQITTIDHGFNTSTFTARVITSSGADVVAAVVGAMGALSGPLHGGAPSRALDLLGQIGTADNAHTYITDAVKRGKKIMGFGHRLYRTDDPRAVFLRSVSERVGARHVAFAKEVERAVIDVLAELKPGRKLYTNVEFYAGVVMDHCGLPRELFTPTFASSRVIGWCANILEQAATNRIIRPDANYVGPPAPQPVPEV
jgi:citrate synthase